MSIKDFSLPDLILYAQAEQHEDAVAALIDRINASDIQELREKYKQLQLHYDKALVTKPDETDNPEGIGPAEQEFMEHVVNIINEQINIGQGISFITGIGTEKDRTFCVIFFQKGYNDLHKTILCINILHCVILLSGSDGLCSYTSHIYLIIQNIGVQLLPETRKRRKRWGRPFSFPSFSTQALFRDRVVRLVVNDECFVPVIFHGNV